MSTSVIALFSALIGIIIGAFLNYLIRLRIIKFNQNKQENKLAFVYLSKLSQIKALEIVIKSYIEILVDKEKIKEQENKSFDLSHTLCVAFSELFQSIEKEKLKEVEKLEPFLEILQEYVNDYTSFTLSDDILMKLPQETISQYQRFHNAISTSKQYLQIWILILKEKNFEMITAELLYSQWYTLKVLSSTSKNLYTTLIKWGNISDEKADELLKIFIEDTTSAIFVNQLNKSKLEEAKQEFEKFKN